MHINGLHDNLRGLANGTPKNTHQVSTAKETPDNRGQAEARRCLRASASTAIEPYETRLADAIALTGSKTGPRAVPLGEAARAHIEALPGACAPGAFLFPRDAVGGRSHSLATRWRAVCTDAKLGRLRLHDLRHTAASQAVMTGEYLPLVGKLLGHRRHRTTAGYAHLADEPLVEGAEKVGSTIAEAMQLI